MYHPLIAEILCCIHKVLLASRHKTCIHEDPKSRQLGWQLGSCESSPTMPVSSVTLPYSYYFSLIRTHVLNQWQSSWSLETQNKLHATEPMVNSTKSTTKSLLPCRDEIIIHRLRIGHTFLTHDHLLKKENTPHCSACQTQLTVEHVLLLCLTWNAILNNNFTVTNLLDLFDQVICRCIVGFLFCFYC